MTVSTKSSPRGGMDGCLSGLISGVLSREVVAASDSGEGTSSLVTSTGTSTGVVIHDVLVCRALHCLFNCRWRSKSKCLVSIFPQELHSNEPFWRSETAILVDTLLKSLIYIFIWFCFPVEFFRFVICLYHFKCVWFFHWYESSMYSIHQYLDNSDMTGC